MRWLVLRGRENDEHLDGKISLGAYTFESIGFWRYNPFFKEGVEGPALLIACIACLYHPYLAMKQIYRCTLRWRIELEVQKDQ